jgi:hypothetical protein
MIHKGIPLSGALSLAVASVAAFSFRTLHLPPDDFLHICSLANHQVKIKRIEYQDELPIQTSGTPSILQKSSHQGIQES